MFDQATLDQLEAGYQSSRQQTQARPKSGGAKAALASFLPLIGGAVGAVGGSFVAPVAGTVAGGAAGSAFGEALRQRITGERTNFGSIGKEAAFGAVPGVFKGARAGVRAVKGARTAKEASAAEKSAQLLAERSTGGRPATQKMLEDAHNSGDPARVKQIIDGMPDSDPYKSAMLSTFKADLDRAGANNPVAHVRDSSKVNRQLAHEESRFADPLKDQDIIPNPKAFAPETAQLPTPTNRSLLSKLSIGATKRGSGIKTDMGVGGIERADEAAQTLQRLGISGSPTQQLRQINKVMASHGKQVDDILAKNPIKLDGTAVKSQVEKAASDPLKYAELDLSTPGAQKALSAHLNKFAQARTAKEVNDYVKVLNKVATKAKAKLDKGGTLTDKESAALAAKRAGDEVLSQYPEIAPLKKDMATLFERNADITKASEKTVGIPILGVKSKTLAQTGAAVTSKVGSVAAKASEPKTSPGATRKVAGALFGQWGTRAVGGPFLEDQSKNQPTTQAIAETANDTTIMPASSSTIPTLNTTGEDLSSKSVDYEAAARDALSQGDYKAFDAIMQLAAFADKKATSGKGKPLSAEASKVIANANSGLQSLGQIRQMLAEDPSVLQKTIIPGRSAVGGILGGALGTSSYDAAARNVADVITRLRTGAAITENEEKFYKSQLPQPGDPPETRLQKLQMFEDLFNSVANRTGTAGTDLSALVEGQ